MLLLDIADGATQNSPPIYLQPGRHAVQVSGDLNGGELKLHELAAPASAAAQLNSGSYSDLGICPIGVTHFQAIGGYAYLGYSGSGATFTAKIVPAESGLRVSSQPVGSTAVT